MWPQVFRTIGVWIVFEIIGITFGRMVNHHTTTLTNDAPISATTVSTKIQFDNSNSTPLTFLSSVHVQQCRDRCLKKV